MDILQLIRSVAQAADSVASGPEDMPMQAWHTFGPWMSRLMQSAAVKWLPVLSARISCEIPMPDGAVCRHLAIGVCNVCQRPTCLAHARVDYGGDAICLECVARAVQAARAEGYRAPPAGARTPPPKPIDPTELARAYELLKVTPRSSDDEVRTSWRKLSARCHPDKHPDKVEAAEKRFKRIQAAYDLIRDARSRKAA